MSSSAVNKKVYNTISKTKEYIFEYVKMKWREQRNYKLYEMYNNDICIKWKKNCMSEATFLIICHDDADELCGKLLDESSINKRYFDYDVSTPDDDKKESAEEYIYNRICRLVYDKEVISSIDHNESNFNIISVPLYYYGEYLEIGEEYVCGRYGDDQTLLHQHALDQQCVIDSYKYITDNDELYSKLTETHNNRSFIKHMLCNIEITPEKGDLQRLFDPQ